MFFPDWLPLDLDGEDSQFIEKSNGVFLSILGLACFLASKAPERHWILILCGFLINLIFFTGALWVNITSSHLNSTSVFVMCCGFAWLVPFGIILYRSAYTISNIYEVNGLQLSFQQSVHYFKSNKGQTLADLSSESPLLMVFLRHFGCTFCRETLQELAMEKEKLERKGYLIVLVHQSEDTEAENFLEHYGLNKLHRISDPSNDLYVAFGIARGNFNQIFGVRNWFRLFVAGLLKRNFMGGIHGDVFRLAGLVAIRSGKIVLHQDIKLSSMRLNWNKVQ